MSRYENEIRVVSLRESSSQCTCPPQMYHIPMPMELVGSMGMSLGHSLSDPSETLMTPLPARFSRLILAISFLARSM